DLIQLFPNRYIDKTRYYKVNELQQNGAEVQLIGYISNFRTVEQKKGKRMVATFKDDTGELELVWFRGQKWISENTKRDQPYVIYGKVNWYNGFSMAHPEMELVSEHEKSIRSAMQAIYPSTEKLTQRGMSNRVIIKLMEQLFISTKGRFTETLPEGLLQELKLLSKNKAMFNIHFPQSPEFLARAQYRLKFEELFYIQLQLISKNISRKNKINGYNFEKVGASFKTFYDNHLP